MAVVVSEKYKGRHFDAQSAEVIYLVIGTGTDAGNVSDADAFTAVESSAPPTWNSLIGSNIDVREELVQGTIWEVAAIYGTRDPVIYQQSIVEYEFTYQAPSEKVYQSLFTRGAYSANGPVSTNMFGGAINVKNENGELSVEGLDLPAGTPTNTWIFKPLHADVTTAYQLNVESVMGATNSFPLAGRATGTMRLVGVDGSAAFSTGVNPKWQIRFAFQYAAHTYNLKAGGITVPFKGGHDLLWGYYADDFNDGEDHDSDKGIVKKPKFLFVEQVFPEANMALLGMGI